MRTQSTVLILMKVQFLSILNKQRDFCKAKLDKINDQGIKSL